MVAVVGGARQYVGRVVPARRERIRSSAIAHTVERAFSARVIRADSPGEQIRDRWMKPARVGEIDELGPLVQKDRDAFSDVDDRILPIMAREPAAVAAVVDLHEAVTVPLVAKAARIEAEARTRLAADDARDERRIDAVRLRGAYDRLLVKTHRVRV